MTDERQEVDEGKPPFFKNWSGMYWLVIATLAVFILLFYLFTLRYS